jgi:hypothetical protein
MPVIPAMAMPDLLQAILWIVYGFIIIAATVMGAFTSSFVARRVAGVLWRDLSRGVILRIRVLGGACGGILAYLLLGGLNMGAGFGFGPGTGQVSQQGASVPEGSAEAPSPKPKPSEPDAKQGLLPAVTGPSLVRIQLLGQTTQPPYRPQNRFFAFVDDPTPEPLDVEGVMRRLEELQKPGNLKEVELVVSPGSTSLRNLEVQRLEREVARAGLRFYAPNPDNLQFPKDGDG